MPWLLAVRIDGERPHLTACRRIEMQRSAADQLAAGEREREIADVFRHLELGARQHDALGRVAVDETEQRMNIGHRGLADD